MTYREMADFLGMKEESARRRAQREGWPRQLGNDGRTRVGVPGDAAPDDAKAAGATDGGDNRPAGEVAVLREALDRERERADRERERAERAEAAAAVVPELRERLGRAEGESGALREQITAVRATLTEQVTAERARAEAVRAELEYWTAGGPLARALRVLLYRRGRP